MSENILPYLLGNLIPILLTLIVVIIFFIIIDKIFSPFKKAKEKWQNYKYNNKRKKIQALENEIMGWETKFQENKSIISKMKEQLNELSKIFNKIVELESEYTKNIDDLEQKKDRFMEMENKKSMFVNIIRKVQKRRITSQINRLGEKLKINEKDINIGKEAIKNKITEMLSFN